MVGSCHLSPPLCFLQIAYQNTNLEESWNPASNPEVLLGVVASEGRLAVRALRDWCQALGVEYVQPDCKVWHAHAYNSSSSRSRVECRRKHLRCGSGTG